MSKEMRNMINDFNKLLTENRIDEAANATFVKDFLVDFATLMSLNFSQITKMGKDEEATKELKIMV
jgi:hypothetical protein